MKEKFTDIQKEELQIIATRASDLHQNVNQEYDSGLPYSYHLLQVASIMDAFVWPDIDYDTYKVLWFGALFHDSIEDARQTYNDVAKIALRYMDLEHATQATEIVYALTNEKGRTRKERANQKYYQGIRETKYAPFIKACDRLANFRYAKSMGSSMVSAYTKEMPEFLKSIKSDTNPIPQGLIDELLDFV